jgi:hypothetical protein
MELLLIINKLSRGIYKMSEIDNIINKIKDIENISKDKEVAEKLGITEQNLYQMKKREKIPYFEIINYCNIKNITTDLFFLNKTIENKQNVSYYEKIESTIKNLNEKECKYFYFLIESELAKKEI